MRHRDIIVQHEGETLEQALKRTLKEDEESEREYKKPRLMTDRIDLRGFVRIIYDDVLKTRIMEDLDINKYTFEEVLKLFGIKYNHGVVYLWIEDYLDGEIWQFGNNDEKYWYYHGETNGFA